MRMRKNKMLSWLLTAIIVLHIIEPAVIGSVEGAEHIEHSYVDGVCTDCGFEQETEGVPDEEIPTEEPPVLRNAVPHSHAICGASCTNATHNIQEYKPIPEDFTGGVLADGGYYLDRDITLTASIAVDAVDAVYLCLNGYTLYASHGAAAIDAEGKLYLCDCTGTEHVETPTGNGIWVLDETAETRGEDETAETRGEDETAETRGEDETAETRGEDETAETRGEDETAETRGEDETAETRGEDETAETRGEDETAETRGEDETAETRGEDETAETRGEDETAETRGEDETAETRGEDETAETRGEDETTHTEHTYENGICTVCGEPQERQSTDSHSHPLCGTTCICGGGHSATEFTAISADFTGGELASGNYYLNGDLTLTAPITFAANAVVNLCLNGHVLKAPTSGDNRSVFILDMGLGASNATLNLTDCGDTAHKFTPDTSGLWVLDEANGTETVTGGVITGGTGLSAENVTYGGAIYMYGNNTVNIYGGNVVGNRAAQMGGAVYMNGGTDTPPALNICGGGFYGNASNVDGGAIGARAGTITVGNARFEANKATTSGGAIYTLNGYTSSNTTYINNTARGSGAVWTKGTATVTNDSYQVNQTTEWDAGAIYVDNGTLSINKSTFTGNTAVGHGGAIYLKSGTVNVGESSFTENISSKDGGAIRVETGTLQSKNTDYSGNKANMSGGAIFGLDTSTMVINGGTFIQNKTTHQTNDGNGGAIGAWNDTKLTVENAAFTENEGLWGGAIRTNGASLVHIENSTFTGNKAVKYSGTTGYGGALRIMGTTNAVITGCTFTGNTAARSGGAIFAGSPITLTGSTITENAAGLDGDAADGGGLRFDGNYTFTIQGTTIQNNTTTTGGRGGGVFVESGTLTLSGKVVVTDNTLNDTANNVMLLSSLISFAEGGLAAESAIGIYGEGEFANPCDTDYSTYFTSDNGYSIVYTANKTLAARSGEVHYHPLCGTTCSCGGGHSATEFASIPVDYTGGDLSGSYYLTNDLALQSPIVVPAGTTLSLCLNGHTLTAPEESSAITANGTLNLADCGTTEHKFREVTEVIDQYFTAEYWVLDEENGTETVTGGMIVGGTGTKTQPYGSRGGGICVNGTMNMYGGVITGGNVSYGNNYGGGVYLAHGGTMNMYGGSIVGNKAAGFGGGVYFGGTMNMYGGSITGNNAGQNGGGVASLRGTFTMYRGTISENSAYIHGGGVYLCPNDGNITFTMNGGSITGNRALSGGGVLNWADFTMKGGSITGNTAFGMLFNGHVQTGGGVHTNGSSFTLSGDAVIQDNYYVEGENEPKKNNIYNPGE